MTRRHPSAGIVATLATLLIWGAASAAPFGFDDSGIDYSNGDVDTAYLQLSLDDGRLLVTLDDQPTTATLLPVKFDEVPVRHRVDIFGDDVHEGILESGSDVRVDRYGRAVKGLTVTHRGVSVREATEAYRNSLGRLGFDVSVERSSNGNFATVTATNDEDTIRVSIHRGSREGTARIAGL
jgi:hypothetical protein